MDLGDEPTFLSEALHESILTSPAILDSEAAINLFLVVLTLHLDYFANCSLQKLKNIENWLTSLGMT